MARRVATERAARGAIERHGALLVYPIANRKEPASLWSELYPGVEMRWAWDESADDRVVDLWHLRERLARSGEVVYSKWFKNRAVFFSRALFTAMLAEVIPRVAPLDREARDILQLLEEDSPQSTKRLRQEAGLVGRENERDWMRAMRALFEGLHIVGTGEVDDGAFPSLAVGATRSIFEDLWTTAESGPTSAQRELLERALPPESPFGKHWRLLTSLGPAPSRRSART